MRPQKKRKNKVSIKKLFLIGIATVGIGIIAGIVWFVSSPSDNNSKPTVPPTAGGESFGTYFSMFFLGRTGDGSRVRGNSALVRTEKFIEGEKVGIRVQTAPGVSRDIPVELRFYTNDLREETDFLKKYRYKFTVGPGLKSYCCVQIPKKPGRVTMSILVNDKLLGSLRNLQIKSAELYKKPELGW